MRYSRRSVVGSLLSAGIVGCTGGRSSGSSGFDEPVMPDSSSDTGPTDTGPVDTADAFAMPAEWAPHAGCIMQFPPPGHYCGPGTTDCTLIEKARAEWAAVASTIAEHEPVVMYATPDDAALARKQCSSAVTVVEAMMDDGWSRDTGPVLVKNSAGVVRARCFGFNGWGESYSHTLDALIKWEMAADLGIPTDDHPMILEGGAVIVDGAGTLITTEECLLHKSRNPHLSQGEQETILKEMFGVHTIIWLENGWVPDPLTNGHVDGIVAYVAPGKVVLNSIAQSEDPTNHAILESARERLEAAGIEVVRLPATSWTAFHINFYTANGAIIVPIEGRASVDDVPLGILADLHPDHVVVGVEANTLGQAGGGIHCITQQVPQGVIWPY
jgi:agmatine deiminase